ncbi:MAG: NAD(P)/FAD-dependent oxidoreductase [Kiloniellales bacterium]
MNVPASADVVVAGAGIVGCATAYALAKRGLKVVLVDKGSVGGAVSGASLACIGAHMVDIGELPLLQTACTLWRGYQDELERDIEYQRCGQLRFIAREGDFVAARRWLDQERAGGLEVSLLDPREVREIVPALSGPILGATWSPNDATVNPFLSCRALVEAARTRGAELVTGTAVIGITETDGRVSAVLTTAGVIATRWLVNACGPWAGRLAERVGHSLPIQPRKAQCLATVRLPPTIPCVVGACEAGGGVEAGYSQIQQAKSGQVLFNTVLGGGLRNPGTEEQELSIDRAFVRDSVRTLLWLFPGLEDVMLLRSWARYEAVTPDDRFLVGPLAGLEGFLMAAGDNGIGFTRAPLIARALTEIIAGDDRTLDIGCYDPERFTALPEEAERIGSHA